MNFNHSYFLLMILLISSVSLFNVNAQESNNTSDEGSLSLENEQGLQIEDEAISTATTTIDDVNQQAGIQDPRQQDQQQQQQQELSVPNQEQDNVTTPSPSEREIETESQDETSPKTLIPVADAGSDRTVNAGEEIELDGTGSYARNGTIVSYNWQVEDWDDVEENIPTLEDSDTAVPTLIAPYPTRTPSSSYGIELQVTDSNGLSDSDFMVVRVITPFEGSLIPQANAGGDQTVEEGQQVALWGLNSYARNGTIVDYEWTWKDWPAGQEEKNLPQLYDANTYRTYFTAPQVTSDFDDEYVIELKVTDSNGLSDSDDATISVLSKDITTLLDPVADAGQDQTVDEGDRVILEGIGSYARNGTIVEYDWSLNDWADEEQNLPQLYDTDKPLAWFIAPHPTAGPSSQYNFELQVFDSNGLGDSDDVRVNVLAENATNTRPIAIAEINDDDVCEGRTVTLDGSGSHDHDDDDQIISYKWEVTKGDDNDEYPKITNENAMRTTLDTDNILNSNSATYEIELTVRDRNGASDTDRIVLYVEKCPARDQQGEDDGDGNGDTTDLTEQGQIETTFEGITDNTLLITDQGQPITFQSMNLKTIDDLLTQFTLRNDSRIILATPDCDPISSIANLSGQEIQPAGLMMLSFFNNCQIDNGMIELNITSENAQEYMNLFTGNMGNVSSDIIKLNLSDFLITSTQQLPQESEQLQQQRQDQQQQLTETAVIETKIPDQLIYNIPLNITMTGLEPTTNITKDVSQVNTIILTNGNQTYPLIIESNSYANVTVGFRG
jgi:hypothetical protein